MGWGREGCHAHAPPLVLDVGYNVLMELGSGPTPCPFRLCTRLCHNLYNLTLGWLDEPASLTPPEMFQLLTFKYKYPTLYNKKHHVI